VKVPDTRRPEGGRPVRHVLVVVSRLPGTYSSCALARFLARCLTASFSHLCAVARPREPHREPRQPQCGVPRRARVVEPGCGWGVVGIVCATMFLAPVMGLDVDAAVCPSLQLHTQRHGVHLAPARAPARTVRPRSSRRPS
jgi:hypothetical protein